MPEEFNSALIGSLKNIIETLENIDDRGTCKSDDDSDESSRESVDKQIVEKSEEEIRESQEEKHAPSKEKASDKNQVQFGVDKVELIPGSLAPEYVKYHPDLHPMIPYPRPPGIIELRGSDLIKGCACLKRNGLQSDCELRHCRGDPKCIFYPTPVCEPSGLGLPRVHSSFIKRPEEKKAWEMLTPPVVETVMEKPVTVKQSKKILQRRKIQGEAEKELYEKVKKEILDRTTCKRVDCNYIKRNPKRNVKLQTENGTSPKEEKEEQKVEEKEELKNLSPNLETEQQNLQ